MNSTILKLALLVVCGIGLVGCYGGNVGQVEGRVLIDGEPQGGFEVNFSSVADGSGAMGTSMQDGVYRLRRGRGKNEIPVGEYKVTVKPSPFADGIPLPKVSLPKMYTETDQAVLVMKVEPGRNEIDLAIDTTK